MTLSYFHKVTFAKFFVCITKQWMKGVLPLLVLLDYLVAFNTTKYGVFPTVNEDWELGALFNSFLSGQFQLTNGGEGIYPSTILVWDAASFSLPPALQHLHVAL